MVSPLQAKPSQAKPSQTTPNYQTDKSLFAKRGISEITNAFSIQSDGKGVFYLLNSFKLCCVKPVCVRTRTGSRSASYKNLFLPVDRIVTMGSVHPFDKLRTGLTHSTQPRLWNEIEIFSEIGIPAFFQRGAEVSVVLRVSGDKRSQHLFLGEAIENETKN